METGECIHPLQKMMSLRRQGVKAGIPSYCSANPLVLEAALVRAKELEKPVLIEATANQVNQDGGYTGMKPADFYQFVLNLAKKVGVPENQMILAGDHLGPLTWQDEPEETAMKKSEELVYEYARAGFTKIHLDTSMKLADDPEGKLSVYTVAKRGARLYQVAMKGYQELKNEKKDAMRPVFVIGSEVPIPGGAQEEENSISVTSREDFEETIKTYREVFKENGIEEGWNDIIAVVVQPGVEFGDDQVFLYDRKSAEKLCEELKNYPEIVFEGHSTDYQSKECLKKMVEDGIAILKVGPALTYGLREALFSLSFIENELVPEEERAHFIEVLEDVMVKDPKNWQKHYHGNEKELHLARKYSFSDRARYYIGQPEVVAAMEKLFANLEKTGIPINMLHQYFPVAAEMVRDGKIGVDPRAIAMEGIIAFMKDYEYATVI